MQTLQKIAAGQDTIMAYNAMLRQFGSLPAELVLRGQTPAGRIENWLSFDLLPQLRPFVFGIMARAEGERLEGVKVLSVAPGAEAEVPPTAAELYLVPLNVAPGALLSSGETQVMILPGDVWWARGALGAKFFNNSAEPLVLLAVHVIPNAPATYVAEDE